MDMRRLIDETDFDNLNELSRRWKKEPTLTPALTHSDLPHKDTPKDTLSHIHPHKDIPHKDSHLQKENLAAESNSERFLAGESRCSETRV